MSDDDQATDPWSRDVPAAPPPASFDFSAASTRSREPAGRADPVAREHQASRRVDGANGTERADESSGPSPSARRILPIAVGVAVVALIAGAIAIGSRDEPGIDADDVSSTDTTAPETSADSTPALERTTTTPPTTRPPTTPRPSSPPTLAPVPPQWVDGQVILPERIAQLGGPGELVALTTGGKVIRIDLADGSTSTIDFDRRQSGSVLHLGATTVLIANDNGNAGSPTLLPDDGTPIGIEVGSSNGLNVIGVGPGPDEFTAFIWSANSGAERSVIIGPDGSIEDVDDSDISPWAVGPMAPTGERWISDAGGVYLESGDGTTRRVSTGQLITTMASKMLVRECDEQRNCGSVVIDIETGERMTTQAPDDLTTWNQPVQQMAMSPDGRTLVVVYWNGQEAALVDLVTGEQIAASMPSSDSYGNTALAWAPDSSGYFTVEQGDVIFVDRTTGDATGLAIEFDDTDTFSDIDVRTGG